MKPRRLVVVRFRRDRKKWEMDAMLPAGSTPPRIRRLFDSEEEATAAAAEIAPRLSSLEPVRDQHMTLAQAFTRYFEAKARKKSLAEDQRLAEHLKLYFGAPTRLRDLTASKIAAYKAARLTAKSVRRKNDDGKPTTLSAASINRPLALLRHLLRMAAVDWEVLPRVPVIRLEREPQGRIRWLEPEEEVRLLDACAKSANTSLLPMVTVALETGLRKGELLGLTWDRIDMSRGVIRLEVTKSGKRREVPMRQGVYNVLSALPKPHEGRVWPDIEIRSAFETAVEAAKLDAPLTFHDLRHSFASWWMMRGGKLESLSKILGHATLAMTMRYAHLSPEHLRGEMAKTERTALEPVVEPNAGTNRGRRGTAGAQMVDSAAKRRGSSVVEQLIRNQ